MLYTVQSPDFDITAHHAPSADYRPGGLHHDLAQLLGWPWFVWCFPTLADFNSPPSMEITPSMLNRVLWTLEVPTRAVKWLPLHASVLGEGPCEDRLYPSAAVIRELGDVPVALLAGPIRPGWVQCQGPATPLLSVIARPEPQSDPVSRDRPRLYLVSA